MALTWNDIGKLIKPYAPTIGTAVGTVVGGPAGAVVGAIVGPVLGAVLNTDPSPEGVAQAIKSDPEVAKKLAEADIAWGKTVETQINAAVAQTAEINQTIRVETQAGVSWYHWRHLLGYVVLGVVVVVMAPAAKVMWNLDATNVGLMIQIVNALMTPFLGLLGLLGYVAQDTTKRYTAAQTGEQPISGVGAAIGGIIAKAIKR